MSTKLYVCSRSPSTFSARTAFGIGQTIRYLPPLLKCQSFIADATFGASGKSEVLATPRKRGRKRILLVCSSSWRTPKQQVEVRSCIVSPTIFREGPYRFFFFSREESRMHIHVYSADGEAKFWLRPAIELAENKGIPAREITSIVKIIERREDEIATAWRARFGD